MGRTRPGTQKLWQGKRFEDLKVRVVALREAVEAALDVRIGCAASAYLVLLVDSVQAASVRKLRRRSFR